MTTAPHKVLLLGWDAPAGMPSAAATLATALAPQSRLTLLLPHLSEPLFLPTEAAATDLSQLEAAALEQLVPVWTGAELASWQAPATPYLGATPGAAGPGSTGAAPFNVPAAPYMGRADASPYLASLGSAEALDLLTEPHYEEATTPPVAADRSENALLTPDDFAAGEPDAEEANHLTQATDDLVPDALDVTREPAAAALPAAPEAAAPLVSVQQRVLEVALSSMRTEAADSAALNFRVIQYARLATRLAASQEFAVVYAADWQAWLAGMEIRQLTGRPLVLQVQSLAPDRNSAADRGWVQALERLAMRRANLVLVATPELAARVTELYQVPASQVLLMPQGNTTASSLTNTILTALELS